MKMFMICPECSHTVDFKKQIEYLFDYNTGESEFEPESGIIFHTIKCENDKCNAYWILTLSGVHKE